MLKLLGIQRGEEVVLPDDLMIPTQSLKRGRSVYQSQAGIPATADSLAYDPVQRLLAVSLQYNSPASNTTDSTSLNSAAHAALQVGSGDGRVKILGQEGVEGLLISSFLDPAPTKQLLYAQNRGGLIRLDEVRQMSLRFSIYVTGLIGFSGTH